MGGSPSKTLLQTPSPLLGVPQLHPSPWETHSQVGQLRAENSVPGEAGVLQEAGLPLVE